LALTRQSAHHTLHRMVRGLAFFGRRSSKSVGDLHLTAFA